MALAVDERRAEPSPDDLVRSRFVPTVVYAREEPGFHTRLCVYNYFSDLFPDVDTGVRVNMWFFDQAGTRVASREMELPYRGQLQFDLSELGVSFEGTAALSMVPLTLPEIRHAKNVGTGYYVYYHDDEGHADYSHEWEAMRFERRESAPWLCVVRPKVHPRTQVIVMNAYYGTDPEQGAAPWRIRLRSGTGRVLAEREMAPLPPRGSCRVDLGDAFADLARLAEENDTLGVEIQGTNIQGPFTRVTTPSGDFNIHHFC